MNLIELNESNRGDVPRIAAQHEAVATFPQLTAALSAAQPK